MDDNLKTVLLLIGLILAIVAFFCVPLLQLWALNTLFPILSIPYGFLQYLAMMVLNATWFYKPITQKVKLTKD